jgi:CheY-like chemotaxis protein
MTPAASQRGPVLRVLVVEDCVDGADSTAVMVRLDGHEVQVARDGPASCTAAETWWPDAILLDIALPGCDAYELARRIREQGTAARPRPFLSRLPGLPETSTANAPVRRASTSTSPSQ